MSITKEDREKMADWAENGPDQSLIQDTGDIDEPALETPWRLNDGRCGVTLEQCNAVRCAADDGLTYRQIADLFGFLNSKKHAHLHSTGKCRHSGGVPPTSNGRRPGPAAGSVTPAECADLRRRWKRDHFDTYREAGRWLGRSESVVWTHINRECTHD